MRRRAKVVEGGEIATIEIMRSSACDGCHKNGGGCVRCDIFGLNKTITAKAENRVGAAAGDRVIIETESGRVIGYAAVVFLLPIVVALALYFAAGLFGDSLVLPYVFSLAGFILTFVVIYFSVNKRAKNRYDITIVGFVGDDDEA